MPFVDLPGVSADPMLFVNHLMAYNHDHDTRVAGLQRKEVFVEATGSLIDAYNVVIDHVNDGIVSLGEEWDDNIIRLPV